MILFLCANFLTAQESSTYLADIQHYTTQEGLSHRIVNDVVKDQRGLIWIGTKRGLNRFDGRDFTTFYADDGLKKNNISRLLVTGDLLWCIHDHQHQKSTSFSIFHATKKQGVSLNKALDIQEVKHAGEIILEFYPNVSNELIIHIIEENQTTTYRVVSDGSLEPLEWFNKVETPVAVEANGEMWLKSHRNDTLQLRKVSPAGKSIGPPFRVALGQYHNDLTQVAIEYEHSLWTVRDEVNTTQLIFYEEGEVIIDTLSTISSSQSKHAWHLELTNWHQYHEAFDCYWYAHGNQVGLITAAGEVRFEDTQRVQYISNEAFIDGYTIWQPSDVGLYRISLSKNLFSTLFTQGNLIGFRGITSIDDQLFFSAYEGVYRLNKSINPTLEKAFPAAFNAYRSRDKELWFSYFEKLYRFENAHLETPTVFSVSGHEIWSIYSAAGGHIWYGADHSGVHFLDPSTGLNSTLESEHHPELQESTVYHFYEKKNGNVLLCTTSGLYELNAKRRVIRRYWKGGAEANFLPSSDIRHLYFDAAAQVYWLATNNDGLLKWDPQDNTAQVYDLPYPGSSIIHAVYPDEFENLWLSTENGIVRFHIPTGRLRTFQEVDGLSANEFNRISHHQDQDGSIYFGSINGVTYFHPNSFQNQAKEEENARVLLVEVEQYLGATDQLQEVTRKYLEEQQIKILPNDRFFRVLLGLSNYSLSDEAIYYYRIGKTSSWVTVHGNEISLSGLPFGEHLLEVRALLPNGRYTDGVLAIPLNIVRPIYLRWWFWILLSVLVVLLAIFFARWYNFRLQLQKDALEKEVHARTSEIQADKKIIERQAEELRALDKTKSRFFANVSHELRTPITLIQGPLSFVLKTERLSSKGSLLLQKAAGSSKQLLKLVEELLELVRMDSYQLPVRARPIVFYTFVHRLVSNFQSLADLKSIVFTLSFQLDVRLQLELDTGKFEKILNNLLSNAFKFTPEQGKVEVLVDDLGSELLLRVSDTGRGIPADDLPFVFDRFHQASSNKQAEGGFGIGLALCKEYSKLMGGQLWVESNTSPPDQGTAFFFKFPKKEVMGMAPAAEEIVGDSENVHVSATSTKHHNQRNGQHLNAQILLVEDNKDLRSYISLLLEDDYQVQMASNGKQALAYLKETHELPQLVISDIMMPIMDGYALVEALKSNKAFKHLPIIMLTARAEQQDRLRALRIGVDDYLLKPFDEEELLVRIDNLLTNASLRKQQNGKLLPDLPEGTADDRWLAELEEYLIEASKRTDLTADQIAYGMHLSRTQLFQRVKSLTGLTIGQYLKAIRLEKARLLLENRSYSTVKEVVYHVGLKDTKSFSKNFRTRFGKLPGEYFK